jgi:hypothetical protein
MAYVIESSGEIEIISLASRTKKFAMGDRVQLVFKPIDQPNPPYTLRVLSPTGRSIVDTIVRDLPTGEAQSAPPFEFSPSVNGIYVVEIREMKGRAYGKGDLKVD